jgi:hypothetical protein
MMTQIQRATGPIKHKPRVPRGFQVSVSDRVLFNFNNDTNNRIYGSARPARPRKAVAPNAGPVFTMTQRAPIQTSPPGSVGRLLLQCRFDYRQRAWNFPALPLTQRGETGEPGFNGASPALLAAMLTIPPIFNSSDNSYPADDRFHPKGVGSWRVTLLRHP